jgi:hypothetical protein
METPYGDNGVDDSSYNGEYYDEDAPDCTCVEVPCTDMDCGCDCHKR